MIITRYGVTLIRLQEQHIELLRQWRNDESISQFMEYRTHITPDMQQRWFANLDPLTDFYFMIEYHGELVGMIHTSGIDWQAATGNAGLFVYKKTLQSTHAPVLASLAMVDTFFGLTNLEGMLAKVKNGNTVAEKYNNNLGFQKLAGQEALAFQEYRLDKSHYFSKANQLRETALKVEGAKTKVEISKSLHDQLIANGLLLAEPQPEFARMLQVLV